MLHNEILYTYIVQKNGVRSLCGQVSLVVSKWLWEAVLETSLKMHRKKFFRSHLRFMCPSKKENSVQHLLGT